MTSIIIGSIAGIVAGSVIAWNIHTDVPRSDVTGPWLRWMELHK